MTDLASNALVEPVEYWAFLGKDTDNENLNEDRCNFFINAASQQLETDCGRVFVPVTETEEIRDGDGTTNLFTKNKPITALAKIDVWNGTDWSELAVATYPYTHDGTTAEVWFTEGNTFAKGTKNYRITYSHGYAQASVPADLKRLCCQVVQRMLKQADGKEGMASESFGDHSTTYDLKDWTPDMRQTLNRYRRVTIG